MGFFSLFSRKNKRESLSLDVPDEMKSRVLTSKDLMDELFGGWESETGQKITWRQAIGVSAVLACVRVLANGVSQVPFILYRRDNRKNERAKEHPLFDLLYASPNEFQTSFELRFMLMMHLGLTNNAFVWINRVRGKIAELLPLEPGSVQLQRDGWDVQYLVTGKSGKQYTLSRDEVWHIKNMAWDGVEGLDAVCIAREVLGLSLATETYGAKFFKNGGRPAGILTTQAALNEDQRKGLRSDWEAMNAGLQNANRTAVLWGGMTYVPLASNNDQNQFLETRKLQIEEVCRALGVNPIMVFHSDKTSTYASAEQFFIQHVRHTLDPWYVNFEQSANLHLLTKEERQEGYYTKLVSNGLMRGDSKDRSDFYNKGRTGGWLTINDIRELEEMDPVEGGDDPFVPLNSNVSASAAAAEGESGGEENSSGNEKPV